MTAAPLPSRSPASPAGSTLRARRLCLFARHEPVVILRRDSPVCRSEGLSPRSQVLLCAHGREVFASLEQIEGDLVAPDEAGLSEEAWALLGVSPGDPIEARHAPPLESLASVRRRIYGMRLDEPALSGIVADVAANRYTDLHLAAFLTATSALPLDDAETLGLTRAMTSAGEQLSWAAPIVVDKHCVGGLPGNRTTPIVVAIAAAAGLMMPKTSSRAITSPAGTADTMETLAPVELDAATLRRVVESEGGCIAWGGAMRLSPADDIFIRVERVLDVDTEGQLVASVLSKKLAAGATHVVIDMPVGSTAKVRSEEAATRLSERFAYVADQCGLKMACVVTDGAQPVGRGIGPALEALDILAVLQRAADAPQDLRRRACLLAGAALELAGAVASGNGVAAAEALLDDGRAWGKFQRICEAQGGLRTPPRAALQAPLLATEPGRVIHINNRKIARLAKLAGAPDVQSAGLVMEVRLGDEVAPGQPLLTVHADTPGELAYAIDFACANPDMIEVEA